MPTGACATLAWPGEAKYRKAPKPSRAAEPPSIQPLRVHIQPSPGPGRETPREEAPRRPLGGPSKPPARGRLVVLRHVVDDGRVELHLAERVRAHADHIDVVLDDEARGRRHLRGVGRIDVGHIAHRRVDGELVQTGLLGVPQPIAHLLGVDAHQAVVIVLALHAVALARGTVVVAVIDAVAIPVRIEEELLDQVQGGVDAQAVLGGHQRAVQRRVGGVDRIGGIERLGPRRLAILRIEVVVDERLGGRVAIIARAIDDVAEDPGEGVHDPRDAVAELQDPLGHRRAPVRRGDAHERLHGGVALALTQQPRGLADVHAALRVAHEAHVLGARGGHVAFDLVGQLEPANLRALEGLHRADERLLPSVDQVVAVHLEELVTGVAHERAVVISPVIIPEDVIETGHAMREHHGVRRPLGGRQRGRCQTEGTCGKCCQEERALLLHGDSLVGERQRRPATAFIKTTRGLRREQLPGRPALRHQRAIAFLRAA
ncbi:conserved hypothetical protein [Stigmatella aurantiaca DW4/3-1]|uniref:Uncharacterized protein n=1 Tax=Stigmatella aurantiaca (strain DW4/3-1) TaxID=378806 RepID=Q09BY0_STIAD|nr:conserved hypothetical protein [Stigmatella aurantiaca DW4/3-1]